MEEELIKKEIQLNEAFREKLNMKQKEMELLNEHLKSISKRTSSVTSQED